MSFISPLCHARIGRISENAPGMHTCMGISLLRFLFFFIVVSFRVAEMVSWETRIAQTRHPEKANLIVSR